MSATDFIARVSKPSTDEVVFAWLIRVVGLGVAVKFAFTFSDSFWLNALIFWAGLACVVAVEVMMTSFSGLGDVPKDVVNEATEYPWTEPARMILAEYFKEQPHAMLDWNTLRRAARRELREIGNVPSKGDQGQALAQANARLRSKCGVQPIQTGVTIQRTY